MKVPKLIEKYSPSRNPVRPLGASTPATNGDPGTLPPAVDHRPKGPLTRPRDPPADHRPQGPPPGLQDHPVIFCDLRFWYSTSSTVHTAPLTFSTRTKHLCRLRL